MSRRAVLTLAAAVAVLAALAIAYRFAVERVHAGIERALGPRASVGSIAAGWRGIELRELRIAAERKGRAGWPAEDELRAARVLVVPELSSLWSGAWRVRSVTIDDGYVSLLRARDGRLRVLPSLGGPAQGAAPGVPLRIGAVRLRNATVEFHDATVRQPPHRLRIDALDAEAGPFVLPALDEPVELRAEGAVKGPQRDGRVELRGQITPASLDTRLSARLAGVDLVALQPYLLRAGEGGVRRGTLDLELAARVRDRRLHAPGSVTLTGLEFGGGSGALGTFAGVPRQAVVAAISRDGRVHVAFTLEGRIDDPTFSLDESFAVKVAAGIAQSLGVSVGGVVQGVGSVIKGLLGR